jgi:feruloyl-CoA synthase
MTSALRYRKIRFGAEGVTVTRSAAGDTCISSVDPLADYPLRTTDRLRYWAEQVPDRTFLAKRDPSTGEWRHISYAQALATARRIGQALLNRGLSPERPVLILSENDLEHAMLALACQYVGVPFAPISPAYSLISQDFDKLKHLVKLTTPGMVFASNGQKFGNAIRASIPADVDLVVTDAAPADRAATLFTELDATSADAAVDAAQAATGPDTIVKFLFTSGSTKFPKAVINTHRMLCSNMQMQLQCWPFLAEEPPVLVDWLPWHHTFGANQNLGLVLYNGGTMYIDDGKPTPEGLGETLRNLREIAPTVYNNVPKSLETLGHALEADAALCETFFSRLKMLMYAGAALSQPVLDRLHSIAEKTCGERIVITSALGMTECSPGILYVRQESMRAGQIGVPCPGVDVKLVKNGDKYELRCRGPNVTPGYWRAPEQTKEAFDEEGYLCGGDAVKWFDPSRPELGFVFDGRIAEDFKLTSGTWVSVGPLRARVVHEGAPYVQDAVVTGHDRDEVGLLIVPSLPLCRTLAGAYATATPKDVLAAAPVRDFFQDLLNRLRAQGTGASNRVARALVLSDPPQIDKGEITDKGSINQRAVLTHRAAVVEALYADTDAAIIKPSKI